MSYGYVNTGIVSQSWRPGMRGYGYINPGTVYRGMGAAPSNVLPCINSETGETCMYPGEPQISGECVCGPTFSVKTACPSCATEFPWGWMILAILATALFVDSTQRRKS